MLPYIIASLFNVAVLRLRHYPPNHPFEDCLSS